ncbi:MAG TPA: glycosyltransferase family 1 protein [Verrucomicrobiae bacterium]|nr:glycosyltransferase family 1 protein [Verrucomicrobiae bacterium]
MNIGAEGRWMGSHMTGFGRYARNLLRELKSLMPPGSLSVYVDKPYEIPELFADGGMERIVVPWRPPFYKQLGVPLDIVRRRRRFDLFHFLYNTAPVWTPCPFVLTLHDLSALYVPEMLNWVNRMNIWWQHRLKAARAERIIALSENTSRDIVRWLRIPESKIDVVYHGVEPAFAPAEPERKADLARRLRLDRPFLLYVGTYLPHKNLDTLLRAFARLTGSWPGPLDLVLAGKPGRNSANIQRLVRDLGIESRVRMPGFVPEEDLPALYSLCSAFVFPSKYEGFGMPLLEAMACGAPVLSARSSCLPEVGGDGAAYFRTEDEEGLAGLLERTLRDEDFRQDLVRRGRERAGQFSWHDAARRTLSVYQRVLGRSHVPGPEWKPSTTPQ